jgi:transposase
MRQIREVLRLHHEAGLSYAECGRALKMAKSTAGKIVFLARAAGIDCAAAHAMSDEALEARLYPPPVPRSRRQSEPDFAALHLELKRPGVTLMLLWEEYQRGNELAYKYTSFCNKYRQWSQRLVLSMRQAHVAGEKMFIDYAGQTVPIIDMSSGEIHFAQIFVAVLGASNYTYACATRTQQIPDWVASMVRALEFVAGVPRLIVPDQARAVIAKPDQYDPTPNRTLEEFAAHYGVAILAARPGRPRDKPKAEGAVLLVERWILARLRNRQFFSLGALNGAIAELLTDLNGRAFKKLPGSRRSSYEALDRPALRPLPTVRYEVARWKSARVNIDYHVEIEGHYYSVPFRLVRTQVDVRITVATVEMFAGRERVACHPINAQRGKHTTLDEHMPARHRAHRDWTPQKLIAWGEKIGVACAALVRWQMEHRPHPEQGYRACLGLQRLARQYGPERLEAACTRALAIRSPSYPSVNSIIKSGLDRHPLPTQSADSTEPATPDHANVRGSKYYH